MTSRDFTSFGGRSIACLKKFVHCLEDPGRLLPSCRVRLARSDLVAGFHDCARSRPVQEGITLDDEVDAFLGFSLGPAGKGPERRGDHRRDGEGEYKDNEGRGNQFLVPTGPSKSAFHHTGTTGQNGLVVDEPPQIGGKLLGGRVPALGLLVHRFQKDRLEVRGIVGSSVRGATGSSWAIWRKQLLAVTAVEYWLFREQFAERRSQRVDIGARVMDDPVAQHQLGGHVPQRSEHIARASQPWLIL